MLTLAAIILSVLLFAYFLVLFVIGIIKRKRKTLIRSFLVFLAFLAPFSFLLNAIMETFSSSPGISNYNDLFGKPNSGCLRILHFEGATVPIMDFATSFHFKTCPEELQRIIAEKDYETSRIATAKFQPPSTGVTQSDEWFKPQRLGDSILIFEYKEEYKSRNIIYSNLPMTEAYCIHFVN